MWAALSSGGRAVVMPYALMRSPEDAAEVLRAEAITVLSQTPTAFAALEPHPAGLCGAHGDLRRRGLGGPRGGCLLQCSSECSVYQHVWHHGDDSARHSTRMPENAGEARSPIGRPMDGLRTYVLDAQLQPVQPGETGMMYVAGPQVTAGYWGLLLPRPPASWPILSLAAARGCTAAMTWQRC